MASNRKPSEAQETASDAVQLPRDVWGLILAAAAAPLRELPAGEGRCHVACWLNLALVCKQ